MKGKGLKTLHHIGGVNTVQRALDDLNRLASVRPAPAVQEPGIITPQLEIVKPSPSLLPDYEKKTFELLKGYTPDLLIDQVFDHLALRETVFGGAFYPTANLEIVLYEHRVPKDQIMIITGFCFFASYNNAPVNPQLIFVEPYEHVYHFEFRLLVNGASPVLNKSYIWQNLIPAVNPVDLNGFRTLANDPETESKTSPIGFAIKANPGTTVQVIFRNDPYLDGGYAWTGVRNVMMVGAKLRGFMSANNLRK